MGTEDAPGFIEDAKPVHEVKIAAFEISKTLVTVAQYAECVASGACTEPGRRPFCNWKVAGRENHPVNCVDWSQAKRYAAFQGAGLPSESEWEYAAKSAGKSQKYPWGDAEPDCEKAAMAGCTADGTMPVCSEPTGNTAQGLCDMAGNVWEWLQDSYEDSYAGATIDGTPVESGDPYRVVRGGSWNFIARYLRSDYRNCLAPDLRYPFVGFRLARSLR